MAVELVRRLSTQSDLSLTRVRLAGYHRLPHAANRESILLSQFGIEFFSKNVVVNEKSARLKKTLQYFESTTK
jgi:hypothetical protein